MADKNIDHEPTSGGQTDSGSEATKPDVKWISISLLVGMVAIAVGIAIGILAEMNSTDMAAMLYTALGVILFELCNEFVPKVMLLRKKQRYWALGSLIGVGATFSVIREAETFGSRDIPDEQLRPTKEEPLKPHSKNPPIGLITSVIMDDLLDGMLLSGILETGHGAVSGLDRGLLLAALVIENVFTGIVLVKLLKERGFSNRQAIMTGVGGMGAMLVGGLVGYGLKSNNVIKPGSRAEGSILGLAAAVFAWLVIVELGQPAGLFAAQTKPTDHLWLPLVAVGGFSGMFLIQGTSAS